jgi:hypothetical protein
MAAYTMLWGKVTFMVIAPHTMLWRKVTFMVMEVMGKVML